MDKKFPDLFRTRSRDKDPLKLSARGREKRTKRKERNGGEMGAAGIKKRISERKEKERERK